MSAWKKALIKGGALYTRTDCAGIIIDTDNLWALVMHWSESGGLRWLPFGFAIMWDRDWWTLTINAGRNGRSFFCVTV